MSPIKITVKPGTLLNLFFNSATSFLRSSLSSAAAFFPSIRIINFKILVAQCRASYTFLQNKSIEAIQQGKYRENLDWVKIVLFYLKLGRLTDMITLK